MYIIRKYVYTLYYIEHKAIEIHNPPANEEVTSPTYRAITDDHCKEPIKRPIGYYAEVIIPTPQVNLR